MSKLAATAERLRAVKQASQHFLTLWALDHLLTHQRPMNVLATQLEVAIADPDNRDWSLLYRGGVLDD